MPLRPSPLFASTTTRSVAAAWMEGLPGRAWQLACGGEHTCAVVGGNVYCWGDNSYGQLGVPSSELPLRATPEPVALE